MADEINDFNAKDALEALHKAIDDGDKAMQTHIEMKFAQYDEARSEKDIKFAALEKKNEELVLLSEETGKSLDEIKQRQKDMELHASMITGTDVPLNESKGYKTLDALLRSGVNQYAHAQKLAEYVIEVKADPLLRTDINTDGGFLVPVEMSNELLRQEENMNPARSIVRNRTVSGKTLDQPVRDSILVASRQGESEKNNKDISGYRNEQITPFRMSVTVPTTMDMIQDNAFDIVNEVNTDASEAFAILLGDEFISGPGEKGAKGIFVDPRVTARARQTATVDAVDLVDIRRLQGDNKPGYLTGSRYIFNQQMLAFLRTLKGSNGQFIWQPAITEPAGPTIDGFGYTIMPNMSGPDESGVFVTGEFVAGFGNFVRGYSFFDRTGVSIIRDDVTQAGEAIINWTFHMWNTGRVMIPEAIKPLQVS